MFVGDAQDLLSSAGPGCQPLREAHVMGNGSGGSKRTTEALLHSAAVSYNEASLKPPVKG